ncbi:hypothetical protein VNI00_004800 [Paramarasmius palmivorus]|uniref:Thiaminase-2/PQQC domain-containing protein n=1 Tax=Paramarasmius palmivorus TaxID=297713 RepID=A0AAW0DHV3_9AGAR
MSSPVFESLRGKLALSSMYEDGVATGRANGGDQVFEVVSGNTREATPDVVINKFWTNEDNKDVVDAFMTNNLCIKAAQGDQDALKAYKHYAVQDYFYLLDWFKFRVLRLATVPHNDYNVTQELRDELTSVSQALGDFPEAWRTACLTPEDKGGVGLTENDFQVERTIGEIAYGQFLQNNAREEDWYNLHVILIGCYWAWSKLAVQLYNDTNTVKDTTFYNNWIKTNVYVPPGSTTAVMPDWANGLSTFLDQNADAYKSTMTEEEAQELFRTALRLEVGLFKSAYEDPVKRPVPASAPASGLPWIPAPGQERGGSQSRGAWKKLLGL